MCIGILCTQGEIGLNVFARSTAKCQLSAVLLNLSPALKNRYINKTIIMTIFFLFFWGYFCDNGFQRLIQHLIQ